MIAPASEEGDGNANKNSIFDEEEDGIRLTKAESLKMIAKKSDFDEDGIQVTRTHSLTVIVPPGMLNG